MKYILTLFVLFLSLGATKASPLPFTSIKVPSILGTDSDEWSPIIKYRDLLVEAPFTFFPEEVTFEGIIDISWPEEFPRRYAIKFYIKGWTECGVQFLAKHRDDVLMFSELRSARYPDMEDPCMALETIEYLWMPNPRLHGGDSKNYNIRSSFGRRT